MKKIILAAGFLALSSQFAVAETSTVTLSDGWHYELNTTMQPANGNRVNKIYDENSAHTKDSSFGACDYELFIPQKLVSKEDESIPWSSKLGSSVKITFNTKTCTVIYK